MTGGDLRFKRFRGALRSDTMLIVTSLHLPYSVEVEEKEQQEEEEEEDEGILVVEEQETPVKKKKKKDKKKHIKEEPLSEEEPCTSIAVPVCLFFITIL